MTSSAAEYATRVASTKGMVAFLPSEDSAEKLAVGWGFPADRLHTTGVFLGDVDGLTDHHRESLLRFVDRQSVWITPVKADFYSVNIANPHVDDYKTAITLGISTNNASESLLAASRMRAAVNTYFRHLVHGIKPLPDIWLPHLTLGYIDEVKMDYIDDATRRLGPVVYDRLRVAFGTEVHDFNLL